MDQAGGTHLKVMFVSELCNFWLARQNCASSSITKAEELSSLRVRKQLGNESCIRASAVVERDTSGYDN